MCTPSLLLGKERKKGNDKFYVFEVKQFQTLVILLQVVTFPILLFMLKNTW